MTSGSLALGSSRLLWELSIWAPWGKACFSSFICRCCQQKVSLTDLKFLFLLWLSFVLLMSLSLKKLLYGSQMHKYYHKRHILLYDFISANLACDDSSEASDGSGRGCFNLHSVSATTAVLQCVVWYLCIIVILTQELHYSRDFPLFCKFFFYKERIWIFCRLLQ